MADMNKIKTTRRILGNNDWYYEVNGVRGKAHPHSEKPLDKAQLSGLGTISKIDCVHALSQIAKLQEKAAPGAYQKEVDATLKELLDRDGSIRPHQIEGLFKAASQKSSIMMPYAEQAARTYAQKQFIKEAVEAGKTNGRSDEYQTFRGHYNENADSSEKQLGTFVQLPQFDNIEELKNFSPEEITNVVSHMILDVSSQIRSHYDAEFSIALKKGETAASLTQLTKSQQFKIDLIENEVQTTLYSMLENKLDEVLTSATIYEKSSESMLKRIKEWRAYKKQLTEKVEELQSVKARLEKKCEEFMDKKTAQTIASIQGLSTQLSDAFKSDGTAKKKNQKLSKQYHKTENWIVAANQVYASLEQDAKESLHKAFLSLQDESGKPVISQEDFQRAMFDGTITEIMSKYVDKVKDSKADNKLREDAWEIFREKVQAQIDQAQSGPKQPGA